MLEDINIKSGERYGYLTSRDLKPENDDKEVPGLKSLRFNATHS